MEEYKIKQKVQRCILIISTFLLVSKFVAFIITNSVGILTDAMESIVNVLAEAVTLFSLHWASKPKDKEHPFGHGKMELISASLEGMLIILAGIIIIYEGISRLLSPATIEKLDVGIIFIAFAGLVNYIMGWYSIRVGKKYNSLALIAGGKHLHSDTYSTVGLVFGLILLYITKIAWIDSAIALIFGTIIIVTGISILRKTITNLIDKADNEMIKKMSVAVNKNRNTSWIDIRNTKIIKYGNYMHIDCILTLPWYYNIKEGESECINLKHTLEQSFLGHVEISIHTKPCKYYYCKYCTLLDCPTRKEEFSMMKEISLNDLISEEEPN